MFAREVAVRYSGPDLREWARDQTTWDPAEATDDRDGRPDRAMVPYVEALLKHGVRTYQSCAGHVDEKGVRHGGVLWFDHPAFSPDRALDTNEFDQVARLWGRESFPLWEVRFRGQARSDAALRAAMDALWYVLDIDARPPHGGGSDG